MGTEAGRAGGMRAIEQGVVTDLGERLSCAEHLQRGTGGSGGVALLRTALELTSPELPAVRTEIGRP